MAYSELAFTVVSSLSAPSAVEEIRAERFDEGLTPDISAELDALGTGDQERPDALFIR
jgi:hypothetical protein